VNVCLHVHAHVHVRAVMCVLSLNLYHLQLGASPVSFTELAHQNYMQISIETWLCLMLADMN